MDIVTGLASNALSCICTSVYNEIRNFIHLGRNAREMQSLLNDLKARQADINDRLEREGKIPFHVVENWRSKVDSLQPTAEGITTDVAVHKRCLAGYCPDCTFRLKLSRRVRDCKSEIQRLFEEGKFEYLNGQFGETPPPPIAEDRSVGTVVGKEIADSQRQIEDWLKEDDRSSVIGVHGMGGVGKTTLLRNINNSAMVQTVFDLVIWVTVSQNPNIQELQNSVATRLGLRLPEDLPEGDSVENRGVKLRQRFKDLEEKKKFLLILDDVWSGFNVEMDLGASLSKGQGKIILSTRNVQVCRSMSANRVLELKPLADEEGWELFHRRAFSEGAGDISEVESIARLVAAECKGLPLAINVMAAAMPSIAEPSAWRTALAQLRAVDTEFYELHSDIDRELFQRLKWSYDALSADHLKICFLLCAAFPEDTQIPAEALIEYWISEGLVKGTNDEYLIDRGFSIISFLRDRSLIQTTERERYYFSADFETVVTVHDIVRDFAIHIGKKDQKEKCLFRGRQNVETFPSEEHTGLCKRISLVQNSVSSLPGKFECPNLISLLLAKNGFVEEIPESFLRSLPSLKVLDLSETKIRSLPTSVGHLKQLVYLNVSGTQIEELPDSIGNLTDLQFLNLRGCLHLISLPLRICKLKCLRSLDLSNCQNLTIIPREFSGITSLQALQMERNRVYVGEESESEVICVRDFVNFRRLRKLSLQLKSPLTNGVMGKWTKMRHLHLMFADFECQRDFPDDMREMKELEHFKVQGWWIQRVPDCICALENLRVLLFIRSFELQKLTGLERVPRLKTLRTAGCDKLRALGAEFGRAGGFPTLERLILVDLGSLQSVVGECGVGEGVLEEGALPRLKHLTIVACPELRCVPRGMEKLRGSEKITIRKSEWERIEWFDESIKIRLQRYVV